MRRPIALLAAVSILAQATAASAEPFINEFHYDNENPSQMGLDVGEFIELAGPAGFSLTGWQLLRYNGANGQLYNSPGADPVLTGLSFSNQSNGFGFLSFNFPSNGIQNGSPDGFALVRPNNSIAQFLSYEGAFLATNGPAIGLNSTDIGVAESGSTPIGFSLQLTGQRQAGTAPNFGTQPAGFTWAAPSAATSGALNTGQNFTLAPPPPPPNDRSIAQIQGAGHTSPFNTQGVSTTGVVSQVVSNGYYLLSDRPDANAGTSEGIFVFTGTSGAKPAVGALVRVNGTVSEFLPGGNANNTTITQITGSSFSVTSLGNAVTPTIIGAGGRTPPTDAIETSSNLNNYDPVNAGRDFYESLEGMLVTVQNAVATAPTVIFSNGNREVWVRSDAPATGVNARGGITISGSTDPSNIQRGDFNPERLQIDVPGNNVGPLVNTGDTLGNVTGVISYDFQSYEVVPNTSPAVTAGNLAKEVTTIPMAADRLRVATYNVENLENGQVTRYADLADQIINRLGSPDVVALQELVTNNRAQDPAVTLAGLVAALNTPGRPQYAFAVLNEVSPDNGGVNDDRIVNGYIYRTDRVQLAAPVAYAPGSTTDPAFDDSRAPLVATFTFNGQQVTVVNNHWASRSGSTGLFGSNQPPIINDDSQRLAQGQFVNAYVDALLGSNPNANIVVVGDLNSFYFEDAQTALSGLPGNQVLFNLYDLFAVNERYNYNFDGNAQALDYIYATGNLFGSNPLFDVVRFNSEFLDQFSDHDPLIASFLIQQVPSPAMVGLLGMGVIGLFAARRRRPQA